MWSDGPLDDIGVDFDRAVGEEAFQDHATAESVADRLGQPGFARQARQLAVPGCEENRVCWIIFRLELMRSISRMITSFIMRDMAIGAENWPGIGAQF